MSVQLPAIISSGMVIEKHAKIWGSCSDKSLIKIIWQNNTYNISVENNKWEIWLDSERYGGPYDLVIDDIKLTDVYVGQVFLMCGQSNMEMYMSRARIKFEDELLNIDNKLIREFYVKKDYNFEKPTELYEGSWKFANQSTINDMFAVSYFMAKKLNSIDADIPIGLIDCAVGGSRIESWLKEDLIKDQAYQKTLLDLCKKPNYINTVIQADEQRAIAWQKQIDEIDEIDLKSIAELNELKRWKKRKLTEKWSKDIGFWHGSVYFRKSFNITKKILDDSQYVVLNLGTITDKDETYINGIKIGETSYQYPIRFYEVPKYLLHDGDNTIIVRVMSERGDGGFNNGKKHTISFDKTEIILDEEWEYVLGCEMPELPPNTYFWNYPTGLFNAMLYPVLSYSISAFMWYQGESNIQYPNSYGQLLKIFIKQIRDNYDENLPFLSVQLPNFNAGALNENWNIIKKQQEIILEYKNTALITTDDIGDDNDIHPLDKKSVGERLAIAFSEIKNK